MTTIQEVVLQIKDKNVKWEDTLEEVHFIQALNRELNKTRKMNQIRHKDRRLYNKLKRY